MMRQNINNYFSGLMENEKLIKKNMEKSMITNFDAYLRREISSSKKNDKRIKGSKKQHEKNSI